MSPSHSPSLINPRHPSKITFLKYPLTPGTVLSIDLTYSGKMGFLSSLLTCCASQDHSSRIEAEPRHARVVAVTDLSYPHNHRPTQRQHSYQDSPPEYGDIAEHPLITIDEKTPVEFEPVVEDDDEAPPPASPNSSVVSIPSTRLTDLTSMQTGETARTALGGFLQRASTRGSRPPSYHSDPRRSPSPGSLPRLSNDSERDSVWQHPVMASNWLEVLRQDAMRRAAAQANNEGQLHRSHPR